MDPTLIRQVGSAWCIHEAEVDEPVVQAHGGWGDAQVHAFFLLTPNATSPSRKKKRLSGIVGRLRRCKRKKLLRRPLCLGTRRRGRPAHDVPVGYRP